MGSKYYNPGIINLSAAESSIINAGGGKKERTNSDGSTHVTVYSSDGKRLSYDKYSDGTCKNVHTGRYGEGYTTYKSGY